MTPGPWRAGQAVIESRRSPLVTVRVSQVSSPRACVKPSSCSWSRACGVGDDREGPVEVLLRHLVEVVAVEVREQHEVEGRQVVDLHGRVGQPLRAHAVPEVDAGVAVHERRVGEDREPAVPQQERGVADEQYRVLARVVRGRGVQYELGVHV
ncbi:hypothetical protein ACOCJ4_14505 [Knoellia sp. CPCC 206435]|uniref:hypothetical protein n=1 Tax=Knoellia terrae TaxID=3404797 RepID=UPI003B434785